MKFLAWIHETGRKQQDVAVELNTGKSRISKIAAGKILPRRDEFVPIYVLSQGQVAPNDFFELPPLNDKGSEIPHAIKKEVNASCGK